MSSPDTNHPQPSVWWRHIRWQSWVSLFAMCLQIPAMIIWGIPTEATAPLVIVNIGLVAAQAAYGGGSTLIDSIKAWRGNAQ